MTTLVLDKRQLSLTYEADCLFIRGAGMATQTVPLCQLERIVCMHGIDLSTSLLGQLRCRGIHFVVINSRYPERSLTLLSDPHRGAQRRMDQYHILSNDAHRLALARRLIQSKLHQQYLVSRVYRQHQSAAVTPLQSYRQRCSSMNDLAALRGLEGAAAAQSMAYYIQQFPAKFNFSCRQRRPPKDPVNALLSLSYTLLYRDTANALTVVGLDPWLGFYHEPLQGRYSLACDLMEPLRPQVEAFVFQMLVEEKLITLRHFNSGDKGCLLGREGRKLFYPFYENAARPWRKQLQRYGRWLIARIENFIAIEAESR